MHRRPTTRKLAIHELPPLPVVKREMCPYCSSQGDMSAGAIRERQIAAIRWMELTELEFKVVVSQMTHEELMGMGFRQWRQYMAAKARLAEQRKEAVHG